ncbi:MAG: NAD(P)-dependent glycerol-3-phosphate dehydrogenase [Geminicoccaceae bacterium]|nr:NAD(P)-dependent glycerol-3-phosphate dehydrogenase [Geminicoccaceae bacterium]
MNIAVIGNGSWGTALAMAAVRAGHRPRLWGRDREALRIAAETRMNARYLPGIRLDPAITFEPDIEALADADLLLAVVPAQNLRRVLQPLKNFSGRLISCAKGIERGSGQRMSEIVAEVMPRATCGVLSGPSFAGEVAAGKPTALVCGACEADIARDNAAALSSSGLRLYPSTDLVGIEIGGALKNVIAIAAGVVMGRDLGENARAAVITRGLAELTRLALCLGARPETMAGLSGLGDLVLTASSLQSRNTSFGHDLGRGVPVGTLRGTGGKLSEGAWTAEAALELARRHGVELPITEAVAHVLEGRHSLEDAIAFLTSRPLASRE